MSIKATAKRFLPQWLRSKYRELWQARHRKQQLAGIPAAARELHERSALTSYDHVKLTDGDAASRTRVKDAAAGVYGQQWNYYSDALRPEIVQGFVDSISALRGSFSTVDYLEIGSCQGLSMSLIGTLLRDRGMLGSLVSVDPYFDTGYVESSPYEVSIAVGVDKSTKLRAQELYSQLSLSVEIVESTSLVGLKTLVGSGRSFQLIYIDGSHEALWPVVDFGLSRALLCNGGVVILDDHLWPDVQPLKRLCDQHMKKIQETWKTASYQLVE